MSGLGVWRESAWLGIAALLCWLGLGFYAPRGEQADTLLPHSSSWRVQTQGSSYSIWLDRHPALIGDGDYTPTGRLRADEAAAMQSSFERCRIVRRIASAQAGARAAYGLDLPVELEAPGRPRIALGSGADGNGYALLADGSIALLSVDLAALLRREVAVLREPGLDLGDSVTQVQHASGWALTYGDAVVRLQQGTQQQWADIERARLWLRAVISARAGGYRQQGPQGGSQPWLTIDSGNRRVVLRDAGPGDLEGERVIERSELLGELNLREWLLVDVRGFPMHPDAAKLLNRHLLPLDPRQAETVQIGAATLRRSGSTWQADGASTTDQALVEKLLGGIATAPALPQQPTIPQPWLKVVLGDMTFSINADPTPQPFLASLVGLQGWQLSERRLLPGWRDADVVSFTSQVQGGAASLFERKVGQPWQGEDAAAVTDLLRGLVNGTVDQWNLRTTDAASLPGRWPVTLRLLAADGRQVELRLDPAGKRIWVGGSGLGGILDGPSATAILGK